MDSVWALLSLAVTIYHFVELGQDEAGKVRSIAIVDEVSKTTSYIARISQAVGYNTKGDPQAIAIIAMAVANLCTSGLQFAEAGIAGSLDS